MTAQDAAPSQGAAKGEECPSCECERRTDAGERHYDCPSCNSVEDEPEPLGGCSVPHGHRWVFTGTAYGGDDASFMGEGRVFCDYCGADGDA